MACIIKQSEACGVSPFRLVSGKLINISQANILSAGFGTSYKGVIEE